MKKKHVFHRIKCIFPGKKICLILPSCDKKVNIMQSRKCINNQYCYTGTIITTLTKSLYFNDLMKTTIELYFTSLHCSEYEPFKSQSQASHPVPLAIFQWFSWHESQFIPITLGRQGHCPVTGSHGPTVKFVPK